jgi:putative ABC transport system ATP-binding protein
MIKIRNLFKTYENNTVQAVNDLSLSIDKGEIVALTGPSGCGKSTLLNITGGLDRPDSGSIRIKDQELSEYKSLPAYRSQIVGFVFQFHHLIPSLTLLENVELPMYSQQWSTKQRHKKATDLLIEVGLEHRMHFFPPKVSGGERQRAAIARSMVNNPEIILADEPTGNVDSQTGQRVMGMLITWCLRMGTTLVIATHNPLIADMTQRTICLQDGKTT